MRKDVLLSDLIDRVEKKLEGCKRCGGEGVVADKKMDDPCPQCSDYRYLVNAILIMESEIEKQRLTTFDRFVMAALTGLASCNDDPQPVVLKDHVTIAREYAVEAMKKRDEANDPPDLDRTVSHP